MFRTPFFRGVSACALVLGLFPSMAVAQQSLPVIEVGRAQRPAPRQGSPVSSRAPAAPRTPAIRAATPVLAAPLRSEPQGPAKAYVVNDATTAAKTEIPIRKTPAAIAVVPRQVLQDQRQTRLQDALENVSGVHANATDLEGYVFKIRGFQSNYVFRNGLAIPAGGATPSIFDTANMERIEVLKGPASILYGRVDPGGLINFVTKQPLDEPRYVLEQEFGSYAHYRTQWDVSSPVKEVPGLGYRVSGAYQDSGSFRSFQGGQRVLVAPVVSYKPSAWTEFTVDTQFLANRSQSDIGIPLVGQFGPLPAPVPLDRSFQEPNNPRNTGTDYKIGYNFRQNLNEDWKITNRFLFSESSVQKPLIVGIGVEPDNVTYDRQTKYQDLHGHALSTNFDINGKFDALWAKHNFLFGLDYFNSSYRGYVGFGNDIYPINLYYPIYGTAPTSAYWDSVAGSQFKIHTSNVTRQKGMYIQDYITWFDRLHLLVGVRYDIADNLTGASSSFGGDYSANLGDAIKARYALRDPIDRAWSPRVGVLYDFTPDVSGYVSYSRSFGAANGFSLSGDPLPPERGLQWEGGLKAKLLENLSVNLAVFQITKSGVLTTDFSLAGASKPAGLQRSRGVELDLLGQVTDRLSLVANYAYTDAKVIADNPKNPLFPFGGFDADGNAVVSGFYGNHLDNVPRHSGKVWATYDFGEHGLGWRLGGGVTAQTHAWGDLQNTFLLPGWARLDGFASFTTLYERHKLTAQLNLQNINNVKYFTGVDNYYNTNFAPLLALPAKPFTVTGSVKIQF